MTPVRLAPLPTKAVALTAPSTSSLPLGIVLPIPTKLELASTVNTA